MKIRLGYAAISETLGITSSSSMTYTKYHALGNERGNEMLDRVIQSNFRDLKEILIYNVKNNIHFYRMSSNIIPLLTHPSMTIDVFQQYRNEFLEIGNLIAEQSMRVDLHPDQFCVLNSNKEEVVFHTIRNLTLYYQMFEAMKLDCFMVLHIGAKNNSKTQSMKRFMENYLKLPTMIQKSIILENDDKVYNIRNTLKVCEKLDRPMVLDYHHHLCHNNGEKIEDYIGRIIATWKKQTPKIHFSSPKSKKEYRSHHDYIDSNHFIQFLEKIKFINHDIDIMIEAKKKDEALFRLVRELKYKTEYQFIDETSFYI